MDARNGAGPGGTAARSAQQEVARFAVVGLVALVLVGALTAWFSQRSAQRDAVDDAIRSTQLLARAVVQPAVGAALLSGDESGGEAMDRIVRERVLDEDLVRVKIWNDEGEVVYSDATDLIGARYSPRDELEDLPDGVAEAEVTDLTKPENRFERDFAKLLEVYLPLRTSTGERVLFEAYYRYDAVSDAGWSNWLTFAPAALGGLLALELLLLPLAWRMARRLEEREQERERLLRRAIEASDTERRRIASYLHDGVVQDLAGVSFSLAAAANRAEGSPEVAAAVREAAEQTRQGVRALRSLLVEIYPPSLHGAGLETALHDLAAPIQGRGVDVEMDVPDLPTDPAVQTLIFRVAQESLRNVVNHAGASRVQLAVRTDDGVLRMTVDDDGRGLPADAGAPEGHFGLRLLHDLAGEAGGAVELGPSPLGGTRVLLQVPLP